MTPPPATNFNRKCGLIFWTVFWPSKLDGLDFVRLIFVEARSECVPLSGPSFRTAERKKRFTRNRKLRGPVDPWIRGLVDSIRVPLGPSWTRVRGAVGLWIRAPMDSWICRPVGSWARGPVEPWTCGLMRPWVHEFLDQCNRGLARSISEYSRVFASIRDIRHYSRCSPTSTMFTISRDTGPMDPWTHGHLAMWTRGPSKIWHTRQCHVYNACVEKSGRKTSLRIAHFISENTWGAKFWLIYGLQATPPNVSHSTHFHVYNAAYEKSRREASLWNARSIRENTWCAKFWLIYGLQGTPPKIWHTRHFHVHNERFEKSGREDGLWNVHFIWPTRGVPNSG